MHHVMRRLLPAVGVALVALALAGNAYAAKYVALGDSYSAGNGANSKNLDSGCNRNTYAYPYLISQQRPNTALTFVACAGAQTPDIINNQVNSVTSDTSSGVNGMPPHDMSLWTKPMVSSPPKASISNCSTSGLPFGS